MIKTSTQRVLLAAALCAAILPASAQSTGTSSGQQVYQEVCSVCHETGVAGAPRFRSAADWKPLIAEGQHVLTAHAWVGVRAMPSKGGKPDLKLAEFARAVAYMASQSGGSWPDPDAATMRKIAKEAEARLDKAIRDAQQMKRELHELGEGE
jgi:cytochrome c5